VAAFIARRLATAVPVMLGITFVAFILIHLIPGSPARIILYGSQATPQQIATLTSRLGLNQPLWEQYARFLGQLLRGNLGTSYLTQTSVAHELLSRTPSTLILTGSAMVVAIVIGVPLGVLAGARPNSLLDRGARGISFLGVAIPYFFLALLLVLLLSVRLRWFPAIDNGTFAALVLPAVSLGWGYAAILSAWSGAGSSRSTGASTSRRPGPGGAARGGSCCATRCATRPSRPSPPSACSSATSSPAPRSPR